MPSRPSRSRSPSRDRSPERRELPHGAPTISESDYFQRSDEFRIWLKDEKGKYFDELSGDKARSYFRKFVKAWNKGKLPKSLYAGVDPSTISATTQTAYKWSFASNKSRVDSNAIRAAREEVSAATHGKNSGSGYSVDTHAAPGSSTGGRIQGPTLPSASDIVLAKEFASEQQDEDRVRKRKRDKAEAKERVEDMVGPKEVGREGLLEKKRAKRENDRAFREKGDDGFEADESTLLGGGDSFKDHIARRDAARKNKSVEKAAAVRERSSMFKEKESATMAMFQQLAKERFG